MTIDETSEGGSRTVTPEEACQHLISAIILQAVVDYRKELYSSIVLGEDGYCYKPTKAYNEFENFFEIIGYDHYKRLKPRMIEFRREIDRIGRDELKVKDRYFTCPLCGNMVHVKLGRPRCHDPRLLNDRSKRASCEGCQFEIFA